MDATIEISMYPLTESYADRVLTFLDKVQTYEGITVETNGVSTQLFGDYDQLMALLTTEIKTVFDAETAMFVLKIGKGHLRYRSST